MEEQRSKDVSIRGNKKKQQKETEGDKTAEKTEPKSVEAKGTEGTGYQVKKKAPKKKAKKLPNGREKIRDGQEIKSEKFLWKVNRLLGSGGFGDIYKVMKKNDDDFKDYAMKTEMAKGDKRMLRLKIEVTVLQSCWEVKDPEKRRYFVEFVDKGITDKFKFMVMGLVGPSLEDIRRQYILRNYSKPTAMNASIQTLRAMADLHDLGWLHRDIKPQNYAVGLGETQSTVYILDFGIARKIFKGDTREIKPPRKAVKFLGTVRYCSRACHKCIEQGRKDDLETWLYMAFDLLDDDNGLPWKRTADRNEVVKIKDQFFEHKYSKSYKIVPKEFKAIVDYVNGLQYHSAPDYGYIENAIVAICNDYKIDWQARPEWVGRLDKKAVKEDESEETSTDAKQSGSVSDGGNGEKSKKVVQQLQVVVLRDINIFPKGDRVGDVNVNFNMCNHLNEYKSETDDKEQVFPKTKTQTKK